jgi:hypothetical protein
VNLSQKSEGMMKLYWTKVSDIFAGLQIIIFLGKTNVGPIIKVVRHSLDFLGQWQSKIFHFFFQN